MENIPKHVALRLKYGDPVCEMCSSMKRKPTKADAIVHHRSTGTKIARCNTCIRYFRDQYSKVEYFDD